MKKQIEAMGQIDLTDFHTHILPEVDDGSNDVETSLEMLRMLSAQGVKRVVSTSHFYASQYSPKEFLEKREASERKLRNAIEESGMKQNAPEIIMGAEVLYFPGISRCDAIKELCISGTDLLLLELPFYEWDGSIVKEVVDMRSNLNITPVLAHLDRYFALQKKATLNYILSEEVLVQINAEAFTYGRTAKKALKMLGDGSIDFLGSDCHNLSSRAPNFDKAIEVIAKKKKIDALSEICELGNRIFGD